MEPFRPRTLTFISCWGRGGFSERCSSRCTSSPSMCAPGFSSASRWPTSRPSGSPLPMPPSRCADSTSSPSTPSPGRKTRPGQIRSADALVLRFKAADTARQVLRASHQLLGALGFCDESDVSVLDRHTQPLIRLPLGAEALALRLIPSVADGSLETLFSEPARGAPSEPARGGGPTRGGLPFGPNCRISRSNARRTGRDQCRAGRHRPAADLR